jgi:hypothetical protein
MVSVLPSVLADDLVARLQDALDPIPVVYGPPEGAPESLTCWVRYGPVEFAWSLLPERLPGLRVTVGIKRGGQYMSEYRFVNDTAHLVAVALADMTNDMVILAGEAPITGLSITEPTEITYAGSALMAAEVTISTELKGDAA